jgi:flagellar protein FlbD
MISLTKLNGSAFVLNAQLIRTVEQTPDTTIRLTTGETIMVLEPMDAVVDRAVEYERLLRGLVPRS